MSNAVAEAGVRRFRDRLALLCLLRNALIGVAAWSLAYGAVVLAARAGLGMPRGPLLWGLCSLPVVFLVAAIMACRALPSPAAVRALLDRHGRCGGLLMASDEVALGQWAGEVRDADAPMPSWRGGRTLALCGAGPAFLLAAFLLPESFAQGSGGALDIRRDADRLEKQLDVLKEEKAMAQARADELRGKLADLRKEALGRDPVKTLEGLDHVKETVGKAAQKEAESSLKKLEDLAKAGALAEALQKGAENLDEDQMAEAMAQLGALAKKLAEVGALGEGLGEELRDALMMMGELDEDDLEALAEALAGEKGELKEKLGRLAKAQLIDPETLEQGDKAGECDNAGLAAYLKENGLGELADALLGDEAGRGGLQQGGGKVGSKLTFGDESSKEGAKFKEQELPQADLRKLKDSVLSAVTRGTPRVNEGGPKDTGSGALSGAKAGGGSATGQTVLPRHRGAVARYFDRPAPKSK